MSLALVYSTYILDSGEDKVLSVLFIECLTHTPLCETLPLSFTVASTVSPSYIMLNEPVHLLSIYDGLPNVVITELSSILYFST